MGKYDKKASYFDGMAAVNIGFKDALSTEIYDPREEFMRSTIREGLWGYINKEGEEQIPVIYNKAGNFSEGVALVKLGNESFFIDKLLISFLLFSTIRVLI